MLSYIYFPRSRPPDGYKRIFSKIHEIQIGTLYSIYLFCLSIISIDFSRQLQLQPILHRDETGKKLQTSSLDIPEDEHNEWHNRTWKMLVICKNFYRGIWEMFESFYLVLSKTLQFFSFYKTRVIITQIIKKIYRVFIYRNSKESGIYQ